jgi:anti-sigma B factor antagonist
MEFSYRIEESTDRFVIQMAGNLIEKSQAIELLERVEEQVVKSATHVVIDMTGFKYMNSTGLNVLIQILTKSRKSGGDTVLCCVPENIRSLMLITKLNSIFVIVDDIAAAEKVFVKTV